MKSSKLFLTSLLAAATMSAVPAWAATYSDGAEHTVNSSETGELKVNGGSTVNIVDAASTVTLSSIKHSGANTAATVNVGDRTSATTVVTTRVEMGDANADVTSALSVLSESKLVITGNNNGDDYKTASLLLGEWGAKTTLTVSGTMLAQSASALAGDKGMELNVSGGTLAVNGIGTGKTSGKSPASSLNISGGGKLILGSAGISHLLGTWSSNLGAGTVGLSAAETTIVNALNFTDSTTGTTFDTTQYAFSGEGSAQTISQGATGGTIKITGTLSGSGIVKVAGSGVLDLSGATVSLSSAIQNSATVTVGSNTVFVLNDSLLQSDATSAWDVITGNTSGITGWNDVTLNIDNFRKADGSYFSGRSGLNLSTAGTVTITGDIVYNLYWKGAMSGTWNKSDTAIFGKDSAEGTGTAFANGDSVTFATSDAVVTIGETVRAGTITISENTTFSASSANTLSASSVAVESGTLTLNGGISSYSFGSVNIAENATLKAIVLPAGSTSAEPTQNTTVDYSGVTGTGTLTLGLRNDNGVGFNLSNFGGTIRVERGTGVTAASRFQLNTSTLNTNARIVVADGNDLVFNDNTNKNVSNSVTFEGSGTIHVNSGCSGTLSGNVTSAGTLTKAGAGTLTFSNSLNLNNLTISTGIVQINNTTDNTGENKMLTRVTIANENALQIFNSAKLTNPTTIDLLTVSGTSATVRIGTTADNGDNSHSGIVLIKDIASGTGTLNLELKANTTERSIFELGASDVTSVGAFTGTIAFSATNTGTDRPGSLVISNGSVASKALVRLATATGSSAILSLGVNADRVTIGGLSSTLGTTKAKVYSGSIGFGTLSSTGYGDSSSASGMARTLIINTEARDYSFNGEILANLNLEKTGVGTQTLAGASSAFNGLVKVSGGVLALADASAIGSGNAVRIDGGQLKVGNGTTAVSLNAAAYTIVLSDAYSADSGVAAIVGTDTANKSSVALATDTKITIELADSVAVSLAAEAAQYQYKIFDTATIDDASFTIDSFTLSEMLKSDWRISGYKNGVLTIAAIPEPSVFGLLAGLGALALAGTRRRRRK